jgi:hypothetical protein
MLQVASQVDNLSISRNFVSRPPKRDYYSSSIGFYSPILDLRLLLFFGSLISFGIW